MNACVRSQKKNMDILARPKTNSRSQTYSHQLTSVNTGYCVWGKSTATRIRVLWMLAKNRPQRLRCYGARAVYAVFALLNSSAKFPNVPGHLGWADLASNAFGMTAVLHQVISLLHFSKLISLPKISVLACFNVMFPAVKARHGPMWLWLNIARASHI